MKIKIKTEVKGPDLDSEILDYIRFLRSKHVSAVLIEDFLKGKAVKITSSVKDVVISTIYQLDEPSDLLRK